MQEQSPILKKIPDLETEDEIDEWLTNADLSEYDLTPIKVVTFELAPKDSAISLRLPAELLSAVKARSAETRIPVQRLIRAAIEDFLGRAPAKRTRKPSSKAPRKSKGADAA